MNFQLLLYYQDNKKSLDVAASVYLQPSEYASYGIPNATADQVGRASRLIDTWCARAKWGFVYDVDFAGNPAYMTAASPDIIWTAPATISPGQNVVVPISAGQALVDVIGKTVTIEPGVSGQCEVCAIVGVTNSPNTITLDLVQKTHTGPVKLSGGLQIFEERYLDNRRAYIRLAQFPVIKLISGAGRIEYGRRSDQITGAYYDNSILSVFASANWGGAPPWLIFPANQCGLNGVSGQVWVPVSVYLMRYSDVRMWYAAGYLLANLPAQIKQACANIVSRYGQVAGTPFADSTFKKMAAGDTSLERFKDVAVDTETGMMLEPFRANQYY